MSGGDWNTTANWDIGVPGPGTNAVIPLAASVAYGSPVIAPSFRTLVLSNTLSINASGFVIDVQGVSVATNQFDANGNFNFTNAINTPQKFYILELP